MDFTHYYHVILGCINTYLITLYERVQRSASEGVTRTLIAVGGVLPDMLNLLL